MMWINKISEEIDIILYIRGEGEEAHKNYLVSRVLSRKCQWNGKTSMESKNNLKILS